VRAIIEDHRPDENAHADRGRRRNEPTNIH
jgi:hypothetical protein